MKYYEIETCQLAMAQMTPRQEYALEQSSKIKFLEKRKKNTFRRTIPSNETQHNLGVYQKISLIKLDAIIKFSHTSISHFRQHI